MRNACLLAGLLVVLGGCRATEAPEPEVLETEDVAAPVDANLTTDYDLQARSAEDNTGVRMPGDFPSDLPLYASASLINYGPATSGRSFIELSVPAQPSVVERRYKQQLRSSGWTELEDGAFERGGRQVQVSYRQGTPGTWVRIEYPV